MRRLPFPYCFESQVNSCRQVQICLRTAASMPQRHFLGRWLRLNILPGPWKREIATASAGFEVTGRVGRHFSLHASSEAPLPESSAEKIMGTIANWVDIQFRERASCWATIQSSRSFCWLTFLDTQAASGTISLGGHGEIRTASQSLGMAQRCLRDSVRGSQTTPSPPYHLHRSLSRLVLPYIHQFIRRHHFDDSGRITGTRNLAMDRSQSPEIFRLDRGDQALPNPALALQQDVAPLPLPLVFVIRVFLPMH